MQLFRLIWAALLVVLAVSSLSSPAHATNFVSWVSVGGNNANPCTRASPCRNFANAIAATTPGGEVRCLDAADDFGTATIHQSITIDCHDVPAVVTGNCFDIQLTTSVQTDPLQTVKIRGVTCDAQGVSNFGVRITFANAVFLEDMLITGFGGQGVLDAKTGAGSLFIRNCVITNNGGQGGGAGIFVAPAAGGAARVLVEHTQVGNNSYGVFANGTAGTALVEVKDSTIGSNSISGVWAYTTGSTASIVVDHSASVNHPGSGVVAQGNGAYVSLRDATVAWNAIGLTTTSGGNILTYQNNLIAGNLSAGATPLSFALQ